MRACHRFFRHLFPALGLLGLALFPGPPAAGAVPNVLFIAVDDLRPELGCYGAAHMRTPHIDRLAAQGLLFERAYCQVAVCNPSRASVLSGCRPDTTGVLDNQHFLRPQLPEVVTLPQLFKNHGHTSLSLGKVFHHSEREPGDDPLSWSEPAWYHGEPYKHWFSKESEDFLKALKKLPKEKQPKIIRARPYEAAAVPGEAYPDGQTATRAIETLGRLKREGKPFFLAVGFVKPHLPFTCPQEYWDLYPEAETALPTSHERTEGAPEAAFHSQYELRSYGDVPATGPIPHETARKLIRGYRACVSFMDAQVGRVLAELERQGLRESTVVVLWGDHGYHLGENGLFTKMTNFELGARVPLIVSLPGQKTAGRKTAALVELADLYPTLAALAGLPAPAHLEGLDFTPLLEDPARPWKEAAFSQYLRPGKDPITGRSVRTERWRYTEWKTRSGKDAGVELYDSSTGVPEAANLAADPAHAGRVRAMAELLRAGPGPVAAAVNTGK